MEKCARTLGWTSSYKLVLKQLLEYVPELEERYWAHQNREHMIQPLFFMTEVEGLAHEACQDILTLTGRFSEPVNLIQRILEQIEAMTSSGDEAIEAMAWDFLEGVFTDPACYEIFSAWLGPASRSWIETHSSHKESRE